jgi:hypothetical protein
VRDYLDIAIVFCVEPVKHRRPITPSAAIPSWPPATGGDGLLSLAVACPWPAAATTVQETSRPPHCHSHTHEWLVRHRKGPLTLQETAAPAASPAVPWFACARDRGRNRSRPARLLLQLSPSPRESPRRRLPGLVAFLCASCCCPPYRYLPFRCACALLTTPRGRAATMGP